MADARARILVVDDERFFREAIRDALAPEGYALEFAASQKEALARLESGDFAVVVLDIQLPDGNGLEVLRHLKKRGSAERVVVLSAHTDQEYVLEALRLGACDYLAKPLHEEELRLSVQRAVQAHRLELGLSQLSRRLARLGEVLDALPDDPEALALALPAAAGRVLEATRTSLLRPDPNGEQLRVVAASGHKQPLEELDPVRLGEGVAGFVAASGESVCVPELARDARFAGRTRSQRYASDSFLVVPIRRGAEPLGVLCATDREGGARFSAPDAALLRLLASHAASRWSARPTAPGAPAPEPAPDDDAELARRICDVITREVEPERLLEGVLRVVAEGLGAAPVSLYLLDAAQGQLLREAQWEGAGSADRPWLARGRGLTGAAFETGQPVSTETPEEDPRFDADADTPEGGRPAPLLVVPVRFRGKPVGCVRAFPAGARPADPRSAEVLGATLSAAVRNVLLYRSLVESIEEVARIRREEQARP